MIVIRYLHATVNLSPAVGIGMQDDLHAMDKTSSLAELKAMSAAHPMNRQLHQSLYYYFIVRKQSTMPFREVVDHAVASLKRFATLFRGHVPTALACSNAAYEAARGFLRWAKADAKHNATNATNAEATATRATGASAGVGVAGECCACQAVGGARGSGGRASSAIVRALADAAGLTSTASSPDATVQPATEANTKRKPAATPKGSTSARAKAKAKPPPESAAPAADEGEESEAEEEEGAGLPAWVQERVASLRGLALAMVVEAHQCLQRDVWAGRVTPLEAVPAMELIGQQLCKEGKQHAAALAPLFAALAWNPGMHRARQNLALSYAALEHTSAADKHFTLLFSSAGFEFAVRAAAKDQRSPIAPFMASRARLGRRFGARLCGVLHLSGARVTASSQCMPKTADMVCRGLQGTLHIARLEALPDAAPGDRTSRLVKNAPPLLQCMRERGALSGAPCVHSCLSFQSFNWGRCLSNSPRLVDAIGHRCGTHPPVA